VAAVFSASHTGGAGGAGGGGDGAIETTNNAQNGTVNTGGGGGGGGQPGSNGGTGGSGVVILRYFNAFTISNPGGGLTFTTATDGSDKVTTFTAGTGNVSWS
jgi:hypothetical protein